MQKDDKMKSVIIMIKMLAVDMDGTCLDSKSRMSEKTVTALKFASEKGIIIVPTTGRNLNCLPHRLKRESFYQYAITSNGACVIDLKKSKKIFNSCISWETAARILDEFKRNGFGITAQIDNDYYLQGNFLSLAGRIYYGKDSENSKCVKSVSDFIKANHSEVEEIQLYFLHPKARERSESILSRYNCLSAAYSSIYVEIFDKNASKGIALAKLAKQLNISKEEIACIGDGENDITMFAESGIKFAMGNAVDELKEKADCVLPDNNNDGVAYAIENHLF